MWWNIEVEAGPRPRLICGSEFVPATYRFLFFPRPWSNPEKLSYNHL